MHQRANWLLSAALLLGGCSDNAKFGQSASKESSNRSELDEQTATATSITVDDPKVEETIATETGSNTSIATEPDSKPPISCSARFKVPGSANPYLAGAQQGIHYSGASCTDEVATNAPVEIVFDDIDCLKAGSSLRFDVQGTISHASDNSNQSNADGYLAHIVSHQLGSYFGKSNITAPVNSMVAVFLGPTDPAEGAPDPGGLNFTSAESRNFTELAPALGQIFYIGDGKDETGSYQKFTVPSGATRLFYGVMDGYEWCNNSGELSAQVYWQAP